MGLGKVGVAERGLQGQGIRNIILLEGRSEHLFCEVLGSCVCVILLSAFVLYFLCEVFFKVLFLLLEGRVFDGV